MAAVVRARDTTISLVHVALQPLASLRVGADTALLAAAACTAMLGTRLRVRLVQLAQSTRRVQPRLTHRSGLVACTRRGSRCMLGPRGHRKGIARRVATAPRAVSVSVSVGRRLQVSRHELGRALGALNCTQLDSRLRGWASVQPSVGIVHTRLQSQRESVTHTCGGVRWAAAWPCARTHTHSTQRSAVCGQVGGRHKHPSYGKHKAPPHSSNHARVPLPPCPGERSFSHRPESRTPANACWEPGVAVAAQQQAPRGAAVRPPLLAMPRHVRLQRWRR